LRSLSACEWLRLDKLRKVLVKLTLVLTIFGVVLSTLHQSSLGALYLIAPSKVHPLWYSPYLALFFFVSSMFAGMSMVLFEGTLAHRNFHELMDETHLEEAPGVVTGFAKACSVVMCGYLIMKMFGLALENKWHYLATGYGVLFLVELIGFVALPAYLYAIGARERNRTLIRFTAVWTVLGIVFNRFNVSLVAFNWQLPSADRYFPSWMEIAISLFVVTVGVLAYRFICTRMPIFYEHPDYKESH
jgi:Ni/Fe-hydrogenase subunit HybB-like protein